MNRLLSYLALSVPILAWGLSFPSIKAALTEFPPMTLAFGRFLLAGVVLGSLYAWKGTRTKFAPRDRLSLILSVVTGITLYFLCENHGVKLIPASAASLIIAGIPILTLLADRLVSHRRLGPVGVTAALVSFVGAGLLVGVPSGSEGWGALWGYLLMFGAALAWVMYLFAMKPLQEKYLNLAVTAWQMMLGAVSLAPFALAELPDWRWPSVAGWGHLAFQGLVCSAASYLLYNYALEKLGLRTASLAVNLIPVVTAVASYFLLGELLGPWQWLGGGLVLGAVLFVAFKDQAKKKPSASCPGSVLDSSPRSSRHEG
jgi:drug/metabolite transporter (DMT)-like permease